MGNLCRKFRFNDNVYYYNFEDGTYDSYFDDKIVIAPNHMPIILRQKIRYPKKEKLKKENTK